MEDALSIEGIAAAADERISQAVEREQSRLRSFIRKRVADAGDAEDILQDVFYELVEAYRLMKPVEQVGAWLFRVARNRITDLFRKRKPQSSISEAITAGEDGETLALEDLLPSPEAGPEAVFARTVLLEELEAALDELTPEQRDVFVAHEMDGEGFREMAVRTGVNINTLLSRKRYAVLHLRRRLRAIQDELNAI